MALASGLLAFACASPEREIARMLAESGEQQARPEIDHRGPSVALDEHGPARFVGPLFEAFRTKRAMQTVAFADPFYRTPANPGYDAVIDRILEVLREAGYGKDPRLELRVLEEAMDHPAWSAKSGRLTMRVDGKERELHAFGPDDDTDRTMLPVHSPSASVSGTVAMSLAELDEGEILVTDASARQVLARARSQGAAGVVSASLFPFNVDPSGAERHLDAIQFRQMPPGTAVPVCQMSPRSYATIRDAVEAGKKVQLSLEAEVELEERPLRTVVAVVVGSKRPGEAVAISSHVQEPGACDNASGLAGLLESARGLAELLKDNTLPWPDRSLVFLWGDEFRQTEVWLEKTKRTPVVGISSDMTGQSADTGAIALLERHPDPGAVTTLPPDEHTPWGAWEVEDDWVKPNGLAVIARCAMADVAVQAGGWTTADHPWEGGSDHDVYIKMGVPAALFWHFTDFTYHTSLDRIPFVDPEEMRRTGTALLATALAAADPRPTDLDRYLRSLAREEQVRVDAADAVDRQDAVEAWQRWCYGARMWLRAHCLGPDVDTPAGSDDR
ncbi:MAG: M28 family peptidase [Planctomycetota bacterium]